MAYASDIMMTKPLKQDKDFGTAHVYLWEKGLWCQTFLFKYVIILKMNLLCSPPWMNLEDLRIEYDRV